MLTNLQVVLGLGSPLQGPYLTTRCECDQPLQAVSKYALRLSDITSGNVHLNVRWIDKLTKGNSPLCRADLSFNAIVASLDPL